MKKINEMQGRAGGGSRTLGQEKVGKDSPGCKAMSWLLTNPKGASERERESATEETHERLSFRVNLPRVYASHTHTHTVQCAVL